MSPLSEESDFVALPVRGQAGVFFSCLAPPASECCFRMIHRGTKLVSNVKWFLAAIVAVRLVAGGAIAQGKPIPFGDNPAAGKYYDIDGFKMYCEIYGTGKPVLLIHGNGGSINAFKHNIPFFSEKYQVIAADSRAQGKSKDSGSALTFEMMADDEAALLNTLHIDSAYVIGWSDGGIVALLLAMRHPEKVIKLAATGANIQPDASALRGRQEQNLEGREG